jgi:hypothetical protein
VVKKLLFNQPTKTLYVDISGFNNVGFKDLCLLWYIYCFNVTRDFEIFL